MRHMELYLPTKVSESDFADFLISIEAFEVDGAEKYWNYCLGTECIYHIYLNIEDFDIMSLLILGKDEFIKSYSSDMDTKTILEGLVSIEQDLSKVKATLGVDPKVSVGFGIGSKGNRAVFKFVREMQGKWPSFAIDNRYAINFIDIPGFDDIIAVEKFMGLEGIAKERGFL